MPTALIVEDEPDANTLLSMLVRMRGYRTESALGGAEALERLGAHHPDVVLLDLMLPDVSGYEVCRAIKAGRETTLIPVVVVSAARVEENEARCYAVGANDFIPKPYTPDQVFRALSAADAWRSDIGRHPAEGSFAFDLRDPLEPLRELSRLRSMLRAWTPLGDESLAGISEALRELWASASSWGRAHSAEARQIASVGYRLEPDRVVLTVEDRAGWLVGGRLPPEEGVARWVHRGPFDRIEHRSADRIELICRHDHCPPPPPSDDDPDDDTADAH
ncbi:response regulator [Tautonia plasticadhaerens]|uniref:DNA-binding response regulator MtrA n=1 Tax=Tautonia plasticadhaerens TaxID=2527974 RepID=A0A518H300_9BACT|nr:response regulator [Tautonia plasticadhaerens]QDV35197.1 DNA-binding response regulator MtrA [Tautonia plasticadhaerens]